MKQSFPIVMITLMLILLFSSCTGSEGNGADADDSKVLATVNDAKITQQQLDTRRNDSEFSQQDKVFSDSEVLDKLIEEQLLLIKAKELNITMSDKEVKESAKRMMQLMSSKKYAEGDEDKLDKNAIKALRNMLIIQSTKTTLGSDYDKTLESLRQEVKIEYYE